MKRIFLLLGVLVIVVLVSTCRKAVDVNVQAQTDDQKIQAYIAANHLTMTKDTSGIYYQIVSTNPGAHPTMVDTVEISYQGQLLNGSTFSTESVIFSAMTDLVPGAADGLKLIGANGKAPYARIKIIMPSRLGYGNSAFTPGVPRNSPLVFTFDLIGFHD
jgi:FKBP-type peptidyl-prolyl cis-trans isomerase FkpA